MAKGRGWGEREKEHLFLLPLSPSYSLPLLLSSVLHLAPLSTVHYAWNMLVHSGPESFLQCCCKGSIDVHLGAFDILKSSYSRCNYSCFSISKTPLFIFLFSVLLQRKVFGNLLLMMVFHRRLKRVKTFSKTFVTKYLYKRDGNKSKRTFILIYNYLKKKTRKKKRKCSNQLIMVVPVLNLTYLCLFTDA